MSLRYRLVRQHLQQLGLRKKIRTEILKWYHGTILIFLFLSSCATPTVVNVVGPNDSAMTCNQLDTQIAIANKYADDARKEKDMGTGTNVSALLFWLPWQPKQ